MYDCLKMLFSSCRGKGQTIIGDYELRPCLSLFIICHVTREMAHVKGVACASQSFPTWISVISGSDSSGFRFVSQWFGKPVLALEGKKSPAGMTVRSFWAGFVLAGLCYVVYLRAARNAAFIMSRLFVSPVFLRVMASRPQKKRYRLSVISALTYNCCMKLLAYCMMVLRARCS